MTEEPYFDKSGKEIREFDLLKFYHFTGARKKKHYIYKWVRLKEVDGKKYFIGLHLDSGNDDSCFNLRAVHGPARKIDCEIIQTKYK